LVGRDAIGLFLRQNSFVPFISRCGIGRFPRRCNVTVPPHAELSHERFLAVVDFVYHGVEQTAALLDEALVILEKRKGFFQPMDLALA
jgi:hypothetical protein